MKTKTPSAFSASTRETLNPLTTDDHIALERGDHEFLASVVDIGLLCLLGVWVSWQINGEVEVEMVEMH